MPNQPYFPTREGDQLLWFSNIQSKIGNYLTQLDISPARKAKLDLTLVWLIFLWQTYLPGRRQDAPAATAYRNAVANGTSSATIDTMPPAPAVFTLPAGTPYFGMLPWLFSEVGRWKGAEGFTDIIGQDLGVIGAGATAHVNPPVLNQGTVALNSIELLFAVYEHTGISIESMRQGETAFTFLATDTASPYNDTRPVKTPGQPEWRDYRACWWDHDTASMAFGSVLRVIVNG